MHDELRERIRARVGCPHASHEPGDEKLRKQAWAHCIPRNALNPARATGEAPGRGRHWGAVAPLFVKLSTAGTSIVCR